VLALLVIAGGLPGLAARPVLLALAAGVLAAGAAAWNLARAGAQPCAPSMLYLLALIAFHLGLLVPWACGLAEEPAWLAMAAPAGVGRALLAVMLAIVCYELGLIAGWQRARVAAASLRPRPRAHRGASAFHSGGLIVAVLAATAASVNLLSIGVGRFLSTAYGYEIYASADSRLLQTALFWLLPVAALLALAGARPGREARRALALLAAAALVLLWAGDRGGGVALAAAAAVIWTYGQGPVPRRLVVMGAFAVLIVIPTIGTIRQLPRSAVTLDEVRTAAAAASPLAALTEMGGSVRPLIETMERVPAESPYRLGGSYAQASLRVVPNLGLTTASTEWSDPESLPPNHWITYLVAPWTYAAYGGIGFSAVAEPYLNFGVAGIAAYFLGLGVLLGRLDRALAAAPARRLLALAAVVLMPLLLTARNDFHGFARAAVWGVAIVMLVEWAHGGRVPARPRMRPALARAGGRTA
jgi:hypothetical protein